MADTGLYITACVTKGTSGSGRGEDIAQVVVANTQEKVLSCGAQNRIVFTNWETALLHYRRTLKTDERYANAQWMDVHLMHSFDDLDGLNSVELVDQTVSALTWMFPSGLVNLFLEHDCGMGSAVVTRELLRRPKVPSEVHCFGRVRPIPYPSMFIVQVPEVAVNFPEACTRIVLSHVQVEVDAFVAWLNGACHLNHLVLDDVVFIQERENEGGHRGIDEAERGMVEATIEAAKSRARDPVVVVVQHTAPHATNAYEHQPHQHQSPLNGNNRPREAQLVWMKPGRKKSSGRRHG